MSDAPSGMGCLVMGLRAPLSRGAEAPRLRKRSDPLLVPDGNLFPDKLL